MARKKTQQSPANQKLTAARKKAIHRTRHLLVPHKGNQYRPQLIRIHSIIAMLLLVLVLQVAYGYITTGKFEVLGRSSNITTQELLDDTNAEREKQGLGSLQLNSKLSQAAYLKAQDMMTNGYWAHTSPSGVTPWYWLGQVGYDYSVAGENLAKNYPSADATVAAWMASATHRDNIMNTSYTDVGFAILNGTLSGKETTLVVAYYGEEMSATVSKDSDSESSGAQVQTEDESQNGSEAVAGANTETTEILSPVGQIGSSPLEYFASAIQSLSPMSVVALLIFALVATVGAVAHHYRSKLPKAWRQSWRVHHGMYTFWLMISLGVVLILATGGGSL